jgi:hypothetical protein
MLDHRSAFAVDARLKVAIRGIEEVVAMQLRVESDNAAPEQSLQDLTPPWADAEALGVGPGNVPEGNDHCARQTLANEPRRQGEVVVLHEHDGILAGRLLTDGRGELAVDLFVRGPVAAAKNGAGVGQVAQGIAFMVAQCFDALRESTPTSWVVEFRLAWHSATPRPPSPPCSSVASRPGLEAG